MMQVICNPSPHSFFPSGVTSALLGTAQCPSCRNQPQQDRPSACSSWTVPGHTLTPLNRPVLRYQPPKMLLRIHWRSKATARNLTLQIPLTGVAILLISGLLRAAGGTFDPPHCLCLRKMSPAESHRAAAEVLVPVTEALPGLLCQ